MNLTQVSSITFSPTGSTRQATELIAAQLPGLHQSLDLTGAKYRPDYCFTENEAVLVGVPVYGGRVPATAAERLKKLHGRQTPAILVAAYGNRAYDDALLELKDILTAQGFRPFAAAAVVTEHNIVRSIAKGRPDAGDKEKLVDFGKRAAEKLRGASCNYALTADLQVKGNRPYKPYHTLPLKIKVTSSCTECGACIKSCPVQAISRTDPKVMDEERCIACMRCIRVCPNGGRKLGTLVQLAMAKKLKKGLRGQKGTGVYLMKLENNLDTDDIKGLVWRLAFPSMLAQFVSVFYSIVDRMYIGNIPEIGEVALAGVGICGPIVTLISSFAFLVGTGGAPLMSIRMGEKNNRAAGQILANCFLMLSVMSVILTVGALAVREKLLWWFGAGETTFPYAMEYITLYLTGTVFALMTTGLNQFIISQGFAKVGMKSVMIGAVSNIVLDPVFIFVLHMGVGGAAIATVLSQLLSCIFVVGFLLSKRVPIRITFHGYDRRVMQRVMKVGMTPFIIIAMDNILIISLNAVLQRYGGPAEGDMLLTCNTILQSFMLIVTMPLGGITLGTQTILGYNYGAKRPDRIWKAEKHIAALGLAFTTLMFLAAQLVPELFVRIFTQNEDYIRMTVQAIRIYTLGIIPLAVQYTIVDGFTGMGISTAAMSLSMWRKFVYLGGVFLLPKLAGIHSVFYTEPISDIIATIVSATVYLLLFKRIVGDPKEPAAQSLSAASTQ